ncbi:hypothetical protein [Acinetobacter radioresistens]|uniref:hypothetical protein n=1 Tax=Acinetobacter radioresistens TaxID=40216 RepID=UPI003B28126F
MNSFFPNFENTTIISAPYRYEPLIFFINAIKHLKSIHSGEYQISTVLDQCYLLLNKFISAKEIFEDELTKIRDACKGLRVKGYRTEIINTAKIIFDSVKLIEISNIILETLENLILNNNEEMYGLLVESTDQWQYFSSLLKKNGLHDFVQPIFPKITREQYFDIPIITFLPAKWIPELITLPPSETFILIHPENSFIHGVGTSIFKAPNNQSLEITTENLHLKKNEVISVKSSQEFYSKFSAFFSEEMIEKSDTSSFTNCDQLLLKIEITDLHHKTRFIECNKEYLIISKDGKIKYSSFENNEQIQDIKYIVDKIDTSYLTSEDLRRKQNLIMEKWKKPLRDHTNIENLAQELTKLGAIRANVPNIKNWYDPENIAPRSPEDYRAVLSFAGITDKHEIERFFEFARKRRGDSISEGHYKKVIGLEIVKDYLESIKNNEPLNSDYKIQGIQFSLIALGKK